jgi:hypothetical protein
MAAGGRLDVTHPRSEGARNQVRFKLAREVFAVKFVSGTLLWTPVSPTVSSRRGERLAAFLGTAPSACELISV